MTVTDLLARTTSAELAEWMAYEKVTGPLGSERQDVHMAILAAVISNSMRTGRGRRAEPTDFLPKWDQNERRPRMHWRDMLQQVKRANKRMGGKVVTRRGR